MNVETGKQDRKPDSTPVPPDYLLAVWETVPLGLLVTDGGERCVDANPAFLRKLGYTVAELRSLRPRQLWEANDETAPQGSAKEVPLPPPNATPTARAVRLRSRSGALLWFEVTAYPEIRPGLHLFAVAEPRLSDGCDDERMVSEGQWLNAQRLETLGRLASGIAHDFNNILTAINGHIQLAGESAGCGEEAQEHLRLAHQAGQNARDLVRRILLFARDLPESKRGTFDLAALVRETSGLVSASFPSTLSLELDLPEEEALVSADAGQLQHVLMSLCTLGARAMDGRAGSLKISVFPMRPDRTGAAGSGGFVSMIVSDTGRAMVDPTGRDRDGGSVGSSPPATGRGQGLAVARNIISGYGGQLRVQSIEGVGNRYEVYLPGQPAAGAASGVPEQPVPARPPAGERILVIDDEPAVCRFIELALLRGKYRPEAFTSALEGWARFTRSPGDFDLLVIDLAMPEMAGLEIVQQSRALRPGLPVLLMSGDLQQFDLSALDSMPEVTLLRKPINLHELWSLVSRSLRDPGAGRP